VHFDLTHFGDGGTEGRKRLVCWWGLRARLRLISAGPPSGRRCPTPRESSPVGRNGRSDFLPDSYEPVSDDVDYELLGAAGAVISPAAVARAQGRSEQVVGRREIRDVLTRMRVLPRSRRSPVCDKKRLQEAAVLSRAAGDGGIVKYVEHAGQALPMAGEGMRCDSPTGQSGAPRSSVKLLQARHSTEEL